MKQEKTLSRIPVVPRALILDYEIRGTWWVGWLPFRWMTDLAAKHIARRVVRRHARYVASVEYHDKMFRYTPPQPHKNEDRRQNVPAEVRPTGEVSDQAPDSAQDPKA